MTAQKFTVSFPDELHSTAQAAAGASGLSLSAWLAQAAEDKLRITERIADGLAGVAEHEQENGPIEPTADDQSWADQVLSDAHGTGYRLAS